MMISFINHSTIRKGKIRFDLYSTVVIHTGQLLRIYSQDQYAIKASETQTLNDFGALFVISSIANRNNMKPQKLLIAV